MASKAFESGGGGSLSWLRQTPTGSVAQSLMLFLRDYFNSVARVVHVIPVIGRCLSIVGPEILFSLFRASSELIINGCPDS